MDSNKNNLLKWIPFLCSIAFVNAAYLTVHAYKLQEQQQSGRTSFCDLSSSFSCTEVLAHPAAWIFGIPFPLIALFVYPILFILSILILRGNKTLIPVVFGMSVGGICFNGYMILQETLYIHSYCILCLICTGIIITIAGISGTLLIQKTEVQ